MERVGSVCPKITFTARALASFFASLRMTSRTNSRTLAKWLTSLVRIPETGEIAATFDVERTFVAISAEGSSSRIVITNVRYLTDPVALIVEAK